MRQLIGQLIQAWNPYYVKRNTMIQIAIATLTFIMLIRVWPLGLVENHDYSDQEVLEAMTEYGGEIFTEGDKKLQTVQFIQEHIKHIKVYVSCATYDKEEEPFVLFRLYNDKFACIYEEDYHANRIMQDGYLKATPDLDVIVGQDYYYEIIVPEKSGIELVLPIAANRDLKQYELGPIYEDGIIDTTKSLVAEFDYTKPLSVGRIVLYDIVILLVAAACYIGILYVLERFDEYLDIVKYYSRLATAIVAGLFAVIGFGYAVIWNGFQVPIADRIVFAFGILGGLVWVLVALKWWRVKSIPVQLTNGRHISLLWRDYIQTISFGLAIYALCNYVNADREYVHMVNTRWMLIFLGIAFLMMYTEKKWCNLVSAIWLACSVIGSFIYCNGCEGEEAIMVAKLSAAVVVVWGLVICNTVLQIKLDFWKQISIPHMVLYLAFAIIMFVYRFEKTWPFTATLPFLILLLNKQTVVGKHRLMKNFTNGILVSFLITTVYAMIHRPYNAWLLYRYGGMFHTVAYTGMYLSVVVIVVLAKLYGKIKEKDNLSVVMLLQLCWKELFMFAVAIGLTLLTMTRTAMLTILVSAVSVYLLALLVYQKRFVNSLKEIGYLVAVCILTFPLVFTTVRIVPALSDDPIYFSVEPVDKEWMIYKGEPANSLKYMTIERFAAVFLGRFQTTEQAESLYFETEELPLLTYAGTAGVPQDYFEVNEEIDRGTYVVETSSDISNGRLDIYRTYWKNLTWKGHEKMAVTNEEGEEYVHAHSSYLQVGHDFGILGGILFLAVCAFTFYRSIMYARRYGHRFGIYLMPFALVAVFGVTSVTEWAFHPCIPTGFCFLMMQMVLIQEPTELVQKGEGTEL